MKSYYSPTQDGGNEVWKGGSGRVSQVNEKANVSRSRDCNLEGVPTEVNHSRLIVGPSSSCCEHLQWGVGGGVEVGEGAGGVQSRFTKTEKVRMDTSSGCPQATPFLLHCYWN